jgi:Xaa-Pro dipeptidase
MMIVTPLVAFLIFLALGIMKGMRAKILQGLLKEANIDAFLITRSSNIRYYTGSMGGTYFLVPSDTAPLLMVHKLDYNIAEDQAKGFDVQDYSRADILSRLTEAIKGYENLAFDDLPVSTYKKLCEELPSLRLDLRPDIVWGQRRVKDEEELSLMRRAGELADLAMVALKEKLSEGVSEYELAAEATYSMMREGAEGYAFDNSVGSGQRSAYPHAGVTGRRIRRGDFVTVDLGATYIGYRSDLTRTFIVGQPSKKQRRMYEVVLEAEGTALPEMKAGACGKHVDGVAREIIKAAGYSEYFTHSLGHGIGLEVHEPPSLSDQSIDILKAGNVVSDEPGIYIHGYGGVRVEDTVHVTNGGPERFTKFEKELAEIII